MDHDDDVERLFSWIKTPDLHYREFAGERDVADAVATWPVPRQASHEAARLDDHPDDYAGDHAKPGAAPGPERRGAGRSPLGARLASLFVHREPPPEPPMVQPPVVLPPMVQPPMVHSPETRALPPEEAAGEVPWAPEPPRPTPIFARLEPTAPPPRPEPAPEPPPGPPPGPPGEQYHGFDEHPNDAVAAEPAHEGDGRSLNAIFSRLAHPPQAERDDRRRPTGAAGLGPVFRRLR